MINEKKQKPSNNELHLTLLTNRPPLRAFASNLTRFLASTTFDVTTSQNHIAHISR